MSRRVRPRSATVAFYPCDDDGSLAKNAWDDNGVGLRDISGNGYTANAMAGVLVREPGPRPGSYATRCIGKQPALLIYDNGSANKYATKIQAAIFAATGGVEFQIRFDKPQTIIGTAGTTTFPFLRFLGFNAPGTDNRIQLKVVYTGGQHLIQATWKGQNGTEKVQTIATLSAGQPERIYENLTCFHTVRMWWDNTSAKQCWVQINGAPIVNFTVNNIFVGAGGFAMCALGDENVDDQFFSVCNVHFFTGAPRLGPTRPMPSQWRPTLKHLRDGNETAYWDFRTEDATHKHLDASDLSAIDGNSAHLKIIAYEAATAGTGALRYVYDGGSAYQLYFKGASEGDDFGDPTDISVGDSLYLVTSANSEIALVRANKNLLPHSGAQDLTAVTSCVVGCPFIVESVHSAKAAVANAAPTQDGGLRCDNSVAGAFHFSAGWDTAGYFPSGHIMEVHLLCRVRALPAGLGYIMARNFNPLANTGATIAFVVAANGTLLAAVRHSDDSYVLLQSSAGVVAADASGVHHIKMWIDGTGKYGLEYDNVSVATDDEGADKGAFDRTGTHPVSFGGVPPVRDASGAVVYDGDLSQFCDVDILECLITPTLHPTASGWTAI